MNRSAHPSSHPSNHNVYPIPYPIELFFFFFKWLENYTVKHLQLYSIIQKIYSQSKPSSLTLLGRFGERRGESAATQDTTNALIAARLLQLFDMHLL